MNTRSFGRASRWLNLPTSVLIALLQRSPAVKAIIAVGEYVVASPVGNVIKGVLTAAASLGAVNSLAGATTLSATTASPLAANTGTSVSVAFTVLGTQTPALSWTIGGNVPAGLALYPTSTGGTGATSGTVNTPEGTLYLRGTPTTAGAFTFTVRAWEFAGATGTQSPNFSYVVNVSGTTVTAPTITTDPVSQTVSVGANVTFSVVASGTGLTYQWQKDGTAIAGATATSLTLNNVQTTAAGNYTAVVTNSGGSATSRAATLTVTAAGAAPTFTTQPVSQTVAPGGTATFTVATSSTNVTYQWRFNGTAIAGATAATLTLNNVQSGNAGDYTVVATAATGSTTSLPATLVVGNPVRGRLMNLSVLNKAGAGNPLVAGFIISGSGTKRVVARGTGPSLSAFGVANVLPDPKLELQPSNAPLLASNDSWGQAPNLAAIQDTGLQSFGGNPLNAKDALILQDLPIPNGAAGYTASVSDTTGGSGTCLLEVFDVDTTPPGSPGFDAQGRLSNLSAMAQIAAGGTLTAGFIINGSAPVRLVIRATGPTLASGFGVGGVLPDPKLQLQRQNGPIFGQNDSWSAAANVAEITSGGWNKLGTTTLDAKDAVMVVTIAPGAYTALVSDAGGAGGTALVEIFEWP